MNITPITDKAPACYGVLCPQHGQCGRYAAVEATSPDQTIATCDDGRAERPLFIPITNPADKA